MNTELLEKYCKNAGTKEELSSVNVVYNEVFSSVDTITKVTLPDGSKVWLNHISPLKYPVVFEGDSRTVELTNN